MGWYIYKDAEGNPVYLDDVISDDDPMTLDEEKLPKEIADEKEFRFVWDKRKQEYILKFKR